MSVSKDKKKHKLKTDELEQILKETHPDDVEQCSIDNADEMLSEDREFRNYMKEKLKEKGLKEQDVLVRADIPLGFGYKLFSQEKTTLQRDTILRICYGAELNFEETQHVLKLYHMPLLYARDKRDAMLISCINHRVGGIIEVNEALVRNKLSPLRGSGTQE